MYGESRYQAQTLQRFAKAESRRRQWDGLLDDAYRYALPNHDPRGGAGVGQQRDIDVYDNTAVTAVQWKKARLHGQLFPPFREWMDFAPPVDLDLSGEIGAAWRTYVGEARSRFHQAIERSNFHMEVDPALGDACISTGCLMVHAGTPEDPLRFEAVPVSQLIPEEGADGLLRTLFRAWRLPLRQLDEKWPDADLPEALARDLRKDPDRELEVVEAMIHDQEVDGTLYEVWLTGADCGEHKLVSRRYKVSPGIAFRFDKAPGEWMGRGPVLNVLGDIKTANKVVELILKNATIAATGIWQADDDGVLNLANIQLVPGSIIPKAVGSSGLKPLEAPGRFDVSQLVLERLQENIRLGIQGPSLPPANQGVRTAFEIDTRQAEQQAVELPLSLRLLSELDYPLASRVMSILTSPAMAGSPFYIPPFEVNGQSLRPVPVSPLVRLQDRAEAQESQMAYMGAAQAFPDLLERVVDRPGYLRHFLESNGFPAELLKDEEEAAQSQGVTGGNVAGAEGLGALLAEAGENIASQLAGGTQSQANGSGASLQDLLAQGKPQSGEVPQ